MLASIAVAAAVGAGYGAPRAFACDTGATCHGQIVWNTSTTVTGGLATLNASRMSVANLCTDFVNHEMWVVTNFSSPSYPLGTWVEEGLKDGEDNGTCYALSLFWEEENTQLQTAFHDFAGASLATNYNVKVSYSGSNSWGVYLNGTKEGGTSNFQPCCAVQLEVGGETTTSLAVLTATGSNLQKRGADNTTWSYGWGGGPNVDGTNSPFTVWWVTSPTDMEVSAN